MVLGDVTGIQALELLVLLVWMLVNAPQCLLLVIAAATVTHTGTQAPTHTGTNARQSHTTASISPRHQQSTPQICLDGDDDDGASAVLHTAYACHSGGHVAAKRKREGCAQQINITDWKNGMSKRRSRNVLEAHVLIAGVT